MAFQRSTTRWAIERNKQLEVMSAAAAGSRARRSRPPGIMAGMALD